MPTEAVETAPSAPATGSSTQSIAFTAVDSYVHSNFPVPAPMVCKGNFVSNWEFFCQQWEDNEVATGLEKQYPNIRLSSLLSVMGKECLQVFLNLNFPGEDRTTSKHALENCFKPQCNFVYERYVFNSCKQNP